MAVSSRNRAAQVSLQGLVFALTPWASWRRIRPFASAFGDLRGRMASLVWHPGLAEAGEISGFV
jgi:hypothetical protein